LRVVGLGRVLRQAQEVVAVVALADTLKKRVFWAGAHTRLRLVPEVRVAVLPRMGRRVETLRLGLLLLTVVEVADTQMVSSEAQAVVALTVS